MKTLKAIIYLLLFCAGLTIIIWFLYGLISSQLDMAETNTTEITSTETNQTTQINSETTLSDTEKSEIAANILAATEYSTVDATEVTTAGLSSLQTSYFQTIGTVKSTGVVTIYPLTSGAVKAVNFKQGDYVQQGDTIIELTGTNLTPHASETQLKIAQATLDNAKASLENLKKTSQQSIKTAGLQLQSAINQASAIAYDLAIIEQNKAALQDSINLMENSLDTTNQINNRTGSEGVSDLNDLIFMLNEAQDARSRTQRQIDEVRDEIEQLENFSWQARAEETNIPEEETVREQAAATQTTELDINAQKQAILEEQLTQLETALKTQNKGIDDMFSAIEKAKYGLAISEDSADLSENQLLGQLSQSKSQADVLDLSLQSTKTKLGYTGDTSDAMQLSQQAYNATKTQLETAIDDVTNQIKLAELNVEMAKNQAAALTIKAPFSGTMTMLDLYPGQTVSPQQPVAEVLDPKSFRLEVGVDIDTANRIASNIPAQIELGGRRIDVPISSVGLKIDEQTKLVKVTLLLPNIFYKLNQTMKVYLPLSGGNGAVSGSRSVPLDAVIIGSEKQFIYINDKGKAKRVEVELGEIAGDQIEILTKLDPNTEIIVDGAKDLVNGQPIQTVNAK